jgi:hypothetical protein
MVSQKNTLLWSWKLKSAKDCVSNSPAESSSPENGWHYSVMFDVFSTLLKSFLVLVTKQKLTKKTTGVEFLFVQLYYFDVFWTVLKPLYYCKF